MKDALYGFVDTACGPEPSVGWLMVTVAVFTLAAAFICFALLVLAPPLVRELAAWSRRAFSDETDQLPADLAPIATALSQSPDPPRPPVRRPPYNHTRGDSPLTPCPECRAIERENFRRS